MGDVSMGGEYPDQQEQHVGWAAGSSSGQQHGVGMGEKAVYSQPAVVVANAGAGEEMEEFEDEESPCTIYYSRGYGGHMF